MKNKLFIAVFLLLLPLHIAVAATGSVMLADGCTTSTKFSATTGKPCSYVMVADCGPGDTFSSLTGKACPSAIAHNQEVAQKQVDTQSACINATNAKAIADSQYDYKNPRNLSSNEQANLALKSQIANNDYYGSCYGIYASSTPTAICNDYTYSYSLNHSGSCSYHGGVLVFLQ